MTKIFVRKILASVFLLGFLLSSTGLAQQDHAASGHDHSASADQSEERNSSGGGRDGGGRMQRSDGDHQGGGMQRMRERILQGITPAGQSAMAVLQDVVKKLQSNPDTDWSQVNIEALRQHLIDMDRVALYAEAEANDIPGGAQFVISGNDERTLTAVKRMVPTHAAQIQDELGWETSTETNSNNVVLSVVSEEQADEAMIRALGFAGFMVLGEHHADHHLMMAGGQVDHGGMNHDSEDHSGHH